MPKYAKYKLIRCHNSIASRQLMKWKVSQTRTIVIAWRTAFTTHSTSSYRVILSVNRWTAICYISSSHSMPIMRVSLVGRISISKLYIFGATRQRQMRKGECRKPTRRWCRYAYTARSDVELPSNRLDASTMTVYTPQFGSGNVPSIHRHNHYQGATRSIPIHLFQSSSHQTLSPTIATLCVHRNQTAT